MQKSSENKSSKEQPPISVDQIRKVIEESKKYMQTTQTDQDESNGENSGDGDVEKLKTVEKFLAYWLPRLATTKDEN